MTLKNKDTLLQRKHPAHGVAFVEGQPTIVFDTINTKDRVPWLACDEVHTCYARFGARQPPG